MNDRIYVALDVETTGLIAGVDEIIEVAAVRFRGDEVLETYSQFVRPRQSLPLKITRLTGITPEHVARAPRFNAIGADLARFIGSHPIVGHSVHFDLGMLRAQGMNFAQPIYDTFELATLLVPQAPIYRLGALAEHLGIPHPEDHRALNDALVAARVFTYLLRRINALDLDDLGEIVRLTQQVAFPMRDLFVEALRGRMKRAFSDAPRAARKERQAADEPAPLRPTGSARPLDLDQIAAFFAPDGPLGQHLPGYEPRPSQVEMARAVARAFNQGTALMVEAGTGTGKSLAYLAPAAFFAAARGERVVISTNTINLQDQLFFKDIPALQRIMAGAAGDPPFTAALLKGRGNYLCLKRYHELRRHENLTPDEVRALLKVQLWLPTTGTGDRAELLLMERENAAWGRINVTPETCTGPRCAHFRECFFFKARRLAEAAHIVVINHALLIADLAAQTNVLPPYDHLIIDEAHNLEDVATDQLSFSIDQAALLNFLDAIFLEGGAQLVSGLLADLPARLREGFADERVQHQVEQIALHLRPTLERARAAVYDCFNRLTSFMVNEGAETQYDPRLRITPQVRRRPVWQEIEAAWSNLTDMLTVIGDALGRIESLLREIEPEDLPGYDELLLRAEHLRRFATDARVRTGHIIFGDEESIAWLTHERLRDSLTLTAAPLSVAAILQAHLFAQKQTVVLASATLTIEGAFAFVRSRIGLLEADELALESPFDYQRQALVYIPDDIPEPNQRGYQQAVEQALIELCIAAGGRTLALFTANGALKQTYAAIQEPLEEHEIAVLGQGIDGSRRALLERFRDSPRTVLLGTSSFWEGVDVVGEALSVLVIAKLPFSVPTDPIFAARSERFADPFSEYAVPQSILRFKQGFGRLIRSAEDRGIVVCLDRRLLTKRYGRQFLASLPHTRVRTGPLKQLPALAARFLDAG
ncbi:MAG: helicase C-terminal domain-containing protein [Oscillochloridaceae bacterium]|nr:exonuclease domain-containing protein [Chloroflexaceae bacterium]MDW8390126.1 helicase C-terminal domain-containing protein [Oscillochloridaceae bacterium]